MWQRAHLRTPGRGSLPDGVDLGGALVGSTDADVGVVFRHGASQQICEWLPWAGETAATLGIRVMLFDRRGTGSSAGARDLAAEPSDLVTAVAWLRAQDGIARVAVMGSSLGSAVMFSSLADIDPAPCAVTAVSPLLVASGSGGTVDGSGLTGLPANVWLTWENRTAFQERQAQQIIQRQQADGHTAPRQLAVDTADHSIGLVLNHLNVRESQCSRFATVAIAAPTVPANCCGSRSYNVCGPSVSDAAAPSATAS